MTRGLRSSLRHTSNELEAADWPSNTGLHKCSSGQGGVRGLAEEKMSTLDYGLRVAVLDPSTGEAIGDVPAGAAPQAHDAVTAARAAQTAWARTAPEARGSLLKAGARRLREHARELAELQTRETGAPLAASLGGIEAGISALEAYAQLGTGERGRAPHGELL